MKKSFLLIAITILVACNANKLQEKTLGEKRSETDTVLAFQGIKISYSLDSLHFAELINSRPIKLYDEKKESYTFTDVIINGEYNNASPGEIVHTLCLKGNVGNFLRFISFVCLYEESYGCFSYYQRLTQDDEKMGTFPIGKISELNDKPWTRLDAMSDFIKYKDSGNKFIFVWEWNNQTIVLSYNPVIMLNSSVTYYDTGFAKRKAEEKTKQMLKEAQEREIEKARERQQI